MDSSDAPSVPPVANSILEQSDVDSLGAGPVAMATVTTPPPLPPELPGDSESRASTPASPEGISLSTTSPDKPSNHPSPPPWDAIGRTVLWLFVFGPFAWILRPKPTTLEPAFRPSLRAEVLSPSPKPSAVRQTVVADQAPVDASIYGRSDEILANSKRLYGPKPMETHRVVSKPPSSMPKPEVPAPDTRLEFPHWVGQRLRRP